MATITPTVEEPIVKQDDGTISVLVYEGRTHRICFVDEDITYPPTGYNVDYGLTDKYGNELLAEAHTSDGSITAIDASTLDVTDAHPEAWTGTAWMVEIPDEQMTLVLPSTGLIAKSGKLDAVLKEPGGGETPLAVGNFIVYRAVTP